MVTDVSATFVERIILRLPGSMVNMTVGRYDRRRYTAGVTVTVDVPQSGVTVRVTLVDENGQENLMVMGCYGVGVSRTMAAAIEQHHDDDGIIWPVSIAPYQVVIVPINIKDEAQMTLCEKLYEELLIGDNVTQTAHSRIMTANEIMLAWLKIRLP